MNEGTVTTGVLAATNVVDNAVGVDKKYWYVAIVKHNSEKCASEKLTQMRVDNYLPIQKEIRIWRNGRKSNVDRVVIPSTIFIHCTEQKRRELVTLPFIYRFLTNRARSITNNTNNAIAIIPDVQINTLKFMLGQSDIPIEVITNNSYKKGERVRVIRGHLAGLEGEIFETSNGKSEMMVVLNCLGCARLYVETTSLGKI